jgi:hypothetical protein
MPCTTGLSGKWSRGTRNNGYTWMIDYEEPGLPNGRRMFHGIDRSTFTTMSDSRHALWANGNALAVDPTVDKKLTLALQSLKPAVESRRTTAGVEARSVIGQQTAEKVIHRLFGGQPEPEDRPALAVNDHVHGLASRRFELLFERQLATEFLQPRC